MSKFSHILPFILFWCTLNTHAQSVEQEAEYADKICKKVKAIQPRYQKLVVEQFKKNGDSINVDDIDFLNIYTIYANKEAMRIQRKHAKTIHDKPFVPLKKKELLTYLDLKKIDCTHSFLYKDSIYIGMMVPFVNERKKWVYMSIPFYCMEEENKNKKNALYKLVAEVKPDVTFEICQNFEYFFIKEGRIYGVIYDTNNQAYSMVSLKEYIDREITEIPLGKKSIEFIDREYPIYRVKYPVWKRDKRYEKSSNCKEAHEKWLRKH